MRRWIGNTEDFCTCLNLLEREWPRLSLIVVLLEVEGYSWLAARHGQRRMQECMALVGTIVAECLPSPLATAFRLDAPRFAVLLPCTNPQAAREATNKMLHAIASQVCSFDGRVVRFSATATIQSRPAGEILDVTGMRRAVETNLCGAVG